MNDEKRDTKTIHFHKNMEPKWSSEVYTHTVNGELLDQVSVALYSPTPETDWCISLTKEEAVSMARKILQTFGEPLND